MSLDYREIGARIAWKRRQAGLKQYEVCEMIGVNDKYLSNLETGRCAPSLETLVTLCKVLGTTPNHNLLGHEESTGKYDPELSSRIAKLTDKNRRIISGIIDVLNNS